MKIGFVMEFQTKIYVLFGILFMINAIVFVLNRLVQKNHPPEKVREGRPENPAGKNGQPLINAEKIIDVEYFLIEGCVFAHETKKKKKTDR